MPKRIFLRKTLAGRLQVYPFANHEPAIAVVLALVFLLIFPNQSLKAIDSSRLRSEKSTAPLPPDNSSQEGLLGTSVSRQNSFLTHTHAEAETVASRLLLTLARPISQTYQGEGDVVPSAQQVYQIRPEGEFRDDFFAHQGYLHLQRGEPRRAIAAYLVALTLNPQNLDVYFSLSNIYLRVKNYQLALDLLSRAEQLHGSIPSIDLERVKILIQADNIDLAQSYLEEVITVEPGNAVAWMYQGDIYRLSGKHDLALENYTVAMASEHLSVELAPRLGTLYMQQRDYLRAISYFHIWTEQAPGNPEALHYLGVALVNQGRYYEAQQALDEALALYSSQGDVRRSEAVQTLRKNLDLMLVD